MLFGLDQQSISLLPLCLVKKRPPNTALQFLSIEYLACSSLSVCYCRANQYVYWFYCKFHAHVYLFLPQSFCLSMSIYALAVNQLDALEINEPDVYLPLDTVSGDTVRGGSFDGELHGGVSSVTGK